jgi:hypothetical protein
MNDNVLGHIQHYFSHIVVDYKKQLKDYLIANKKYSSCYNIGLEQGKEKHLCYFH